MPESPDDPIVALATPMASSALAVLRVSGAGSLAILTGLLRDGRDLTGAPGHSLHHAILRDGAEEIDEVLISVFQAPKSYTGEECAEISCHGSLPVIRSLLSLLTRAGFRPAGPGEFTLRAFLNGKMDLTRAEAVNEIVRAKTDRARSLALQRLSGAIEKKIALARDLLIGLRAAVEARLDYPEDELDDGEPDRGKLAEAISLLEGLTRTYKRGRMYQEGVSVAIGGATNSGKSSLFNLFLKQERAIVSDIHGTTRDYLEGMMALDGIPIRLFDTAGMRDARDPLEAEGIRRALDVIGGADLILYLVDSGIGVTPHDGKFLGKYRAGGSAVHSGNGGPALLAVWNKIDLPRARPMPEGFISVSSLTGEGLNALERGMVMALLGGTSEESGEPLIDSERQKDLIGRSLDALYRFRDGAAAGVPLDAGAVDLAEALEALGGITGEVTTAEILERVFSDFCVGK